MSKKSTQARSNFLDVLNAATSSSGLEDMLAKPDITQQSPSKAFELSLTLIDEDPNQPRTEFVEDERFLDMVSSIALRGVKTAISVRDNPAKPGHYLINHGAQRFRASRKAGKTTIPALIDNDYTEFDQLIENVQRKDLSPQEIGAFLYRMTTKAGRSQTEVAKLIGKKPQYVSRHLAFVNPPPELAPVLRDHVRDARVAPELRKMHLLEPEAVMTWLKSYGLRHDDDGNPLPLSAAMMDDLRKYLETDKDAQAPLTPNQLEVRRQSIDKRLQTLGRKLPLEATNAHAGGHNDQDTPTGDEGSEVADAGEPHSPPGQAQNEEEKLENTWFALQAGTRVSIIVEHRKRRAMVDLRRKPNKAGRIFLRYLDDKMQVEVDQKNIRVLNIQVA